MIDSLFSADDRTTIIAIDPASRKKGTGLAMISRDTGFVVFQALDLREALEKILSIRLTTNNLMLTVLSEYPKTKQIWGGGKGGNVTMINKGIGLGVMIATADFLEALGVRTVRMFPKDTGLNAEQFEAVTGYNQRTCQDGRCAGMMIVNYLKGTYSGPEGGER